MERRGFLKTFLGAIAGAATLDPEKLLWVPGQKSIFIPPSPVIKTIELIRVPVRTRLPEIAWRKLHEGVAPRIMQMNYVLMTPEEYAEHMRQWMAPTII